MDDKVLFVLFLVVFAFFYLLPFTELTGTFLDSGISMTHGYATEHVLTCLVPAFFVAGAITGLLKKDIVMKYLGADANKIIAYLFASVSGSILAVCSCTILPLFAGIWKRGAGLGPAITFLYSGPAINIAAIFLTASVFGFQLGFARAVSAILLAIVIGLSMELFFKNDRQKNPGKLITETDDKTDMRLVSVFIFVQILFLIVNGLKIDFGLKISAFAVIILTTAYLAIFRLSREQARVWLLETWGLSKTFLPILFLGVFTAGVLQVFLPEELITSTLGGNSLGANLTASVFGVVVYFATLTEVPILQALMAKGMGAGPALALLLSGPSVSLPSILVIHRALGLNKTAAYISLVVIFSTLAGLVYGMFVA